MLLKIEKNFNSIKIEYRKILQIKIIEKQKMCRNKTTFFDWAKINLKIDVVEVD